MVAQLVRTANAAAIAATDGARIIPSRRIAFGERAPNARLPWRGRRAEPRRHVGSRQASPEARGRRQSKAVSSSDREEESDNETPLVPGQRLDRYELLCPVGEGGMARVWVARLARKYGFEKLVAVKTILSKHATDDRFRAAARTVDGLFAVEARYRRAARDGGCDDDGGDGRRADHAAS